MNKNLGDTVLRQLEQADLILLNKVDVVSPEKRAAVSAWLAERAPGAPLIETHACAGVVGSDAGSAWRCRVRPGNGSDEAAEATSARWLDHAQRYQSWTLEPAAPLSPMRLKHFASALGSDIYRAKGIISLAGDP